MAWRDSDGSKAINVGDYLGTYSENGQSTMISPPSDSINLVMTQIQEVQISGKMQSLVKWIHRG